VFNFLEVLLTPTSSYWLLLGPTEAGGETIDLWIDGLLDFGLKSSNCGLVAGGGVMRFHAFLLYFGIEAGGCPRASEPNEPSARKSDFEGRNFNRRERMGRRNRCRGKRGAGKGMGPVASMT